MLDLNIFLSSSFSLRYCHLLLCFCFYDHLLAEVASSLGVRSKINWLIGWLIESLMSSYICIAYIARISIYSHIFTWVRVFISFCANWWFGIWLVEYFYSVAYKFLCRNLPKLLVSIFHIFLELVPIEKYSVSQNSLIVN